MTMKIKTKPNRFTANAFKDILIKTAENFRTKTNIY